jgi:hypothetical protein
MAVEVFANDATAVVTAGGTTAPAAGTVETWTLSGSTFAAISSSAVPATFSYAADALASAESEKFLIANVSGSTATVTRGADGTTPVAHASGFTVQQVLTRASLEALQGQPGSGPELPLAMAPVAWALWNDDTGPGTINATYAPGTIFFNTGNVSTSGGSPASSWTHAVPAGVKAGDLMLLVVSLNASTSRSPTVSAASGHAWTQVGTTLVQGPTAGWTATTAFYKRVATSGDAGDTLTLGMATGTAYNGSLLGAWTGAADVDAFATALSAGNVSGMALPAVTTVTAGGNVAYLVGGVVNGSGTPQVTGAFYGDVANSGQAFLPEQAANGNLALVADSGAVYPAGTAAGSGVSIAGSTNTQYCAMTVALRPAAAPVPATLTATANGVLAADGGSPAMGDRVVVVDPYASGNGNPPFKDGIYTVTSTGSVSTPWVLTRAADMQSNAALGQYWAVQITGGAVFGGGRAQVLALSAVADPPPFAAGWSFPGFALSAASAGATAPWTTASGASSTANATQASASGQNAVASGDSAAAIGNHSWAAGSYSTAWGASSTALARYAWTGESAIGGVALGPDSLAYAPDQVTLSGGLVSGGTHGQGTAQSSRVQFAGQTTSATPAAITPEDGAFAITGFTGSAYWSRTMVVRGRVVARRTDTPGTDSAWSFQGVLRGNGTSAYTWVGGSAPSMTLIAQDAGASAWAAAWTISGNGLVLTVTGATGETIAWTSTLELDEVAG